MSAPLTEGKPAPQFILNDQAYNEVSLGDFAGRKVLVYFYPKADTPGCTKQSCGLRDIAGQIGDTAIVGVSPDSPEAQAKFDEKYTLGFPLLADVEHEMAEAYGVWGERSMYGRKYMGVQRSAFLIDEQGNLERVWNKITPDDTPSNLLKALGV